MPTSPLKLCPVQGCNARIPWTRRYCEPHAAAAVREREARRPPRVDPDGERTSGGGRTAFWRALRAECLQRDPVCKVCYEQPSKHADHVVPKSAGGRDVLENLQGVCHSCHSWKTASRDGGFGNPRR